MKKMFLTKRITILLLTGWIMGAITVWAQIPYNGPAIFFENELSCIDYEHERDYRETVLEENEICYKFCKNYSAVFYLIGKPGSTYSSESDGDFVVSHINGNDGQIFYRGAEHGSITIIETTEDGEVFTLTICIEFIEMPTADFTIQPYTTLPEGITVCKNQEVSFTNLSTYDEIEIVAYEWSASNITEDDYLYSTETHPTFQFPHTGNYPIELTAINECGCSNTFYTKIKVVEASELRVECPSIVCESTTETYKVTGGSSTSYNWDVIGGEIIGTNNGDEVLINWNRPEDLTNGFGYLLVREIQPSACDSYFTFEIPVISNTEKIIGESVICSPKQFTYHLPLWPATLFNWEVEVLEGNPEVEIIGPPRGNNVVLSCAGEGAIRLTCEYYNTIMDCSGAASKYIEVRKATQIDSILSDYCIGDAVNFVWLEDGSLINGDWILHRPNNGETTHQGASLPTTLNTVGHYVVEVSSNSHCRPEVVHFKVHDLPDEEGSIKGDSLVCLDQPTAYNAVAADDETIFYWEADGGWLLRDYGNTATVHWQTDGVLKLYRMNIASPHCKILVDTLNVFVFNEDLLSIAASPQNHFLANCKQSFEVNYNGVPCNDLLSYEWKITPNHAATIIGNEYQYNPIIQNNYTDIRLENNELQLEYTKCSSEISSINTVFHIDSVAPPLITTPETEVCAGNLVTFTITNGSEFDQEKSAIINDNIINFTENQFSYTFPNSSSSTETYTIRVYAKKCDANYLETIDMNVNSFPNINISPRYAKIDTCDNLTVDLNAYISNFPEEELTFLWYDENGNQTTNETNNYTCHTAGSYKVVVTVIESGCISSQTRVVHEVDCPIIGDTAYSQLHYDTLDLSNNCGIITAVVLNPNYDSIAWSTQPQLTSQNLDTAYYNVSRARRYTFTAEVFDNEQDTIIYHRNTIVVPILPECSVEFSCYDGSYITHIIDISDVYSTDTPYEIIYYLDSAVSDTSSIVLVPDSTHTCFIETILNGDTCRSPTISFTVPSISAQFTISQDSICEGRPLTFTPILPESILTNHTWHFSDSSILKSYVGETNFNNETSAHEDQNILHIVEDHHGCRDSVTQTVRVKSNLITGTTQRPDETLCEGDSIDVRAEVAHNANINFPISYLWSDSLGTDSIAYPIQTGTYTVEVSDSLGCYKVLGNSVITITPPPQTSIQGDVNVCLHDEISLRAFPKENYDYTWYAITNDEMQEVGTGPTYSTPANEVGIRSFVLETYAMGDSCGSTSTIDVEIHANPEPIPIQAHAADCSPYIVEITPTSPVPNNVFYRVTNTDFHMSGLATYGGPYTIEYTNAAGCTASAAPIHVPHPPDSYFWTFPTGCFEFCKQEYPKITHGPAYLPHNEEWTWDWFRNGHLVADGENSYTSYGLNAPLTIADNGNYTMTLSNQFCSKSIGVMSVKTADCFDCRELTDINAHDECCFNNDGVAEHFFQIENINAVWEWNYIIHSSLGYPIIPSSGIINQGNTIPFFILTSGHEEVDIITLEIWNPKDEKARCYFEFKIKLKARIHITLPHNAPPDTEEDHNSENATFLYLYPNPASDHVNIAYQFTEEGNYVLALCDINGKELQSYSIHGLTGEKSINVSSLPVGIYAILCRKNGELIDVLKLIKKSKS